MFLLAFGAVPQERKGAVADFVKSRGMACSVYGAQHLLDALYGCGEAQYALSLMLATHDRSWHHMIAQGGTITWEAWDWKYKNNLDWNHAWGAAPANIIPRRLMGVRPIEPGWKRIEVRPQPGGLSHASLKHPTPLGPLTVAADVAVACVDASIALPRGSTGRISIPSPAGARMTLDGNAVAAVHADGFLTVDGVSPGEHTLRCSW
jgi:hypothetical protein